MIINQQKIVLITGASSGIGLATAVYLAERNYKVYAGIRNPSKKEALLKEIQAKNLPSEILYLDILDESSIK